MNELHLMEQELIKDVLALERVKSIFIKDGSNMGRLNAALARKYYNLLNVQATLSDLNRPRDWNINQRQEETCC